jgi:hypothetical protein
MRFPCSAEAASWCEAAKNLYLAMWGSNLEERLLNVAGCAGLKYLPPTEVKTLQLRALGCDVNAILFREEYPFTLKRLQDRRPNLGGVVVTGQPGIGTSLLQKDVGTLLTYS